MSKLKTCFAKLMSKHISSHYQACVHQFIFIMLTCCVCKLTIKHKDAEMSKILVVTTLCGESILVKLSAQNWWEPVPSPCTNKSRHSWSIFNFKAHEKPFFPPSVKPSCIVAFRPVGTYRDCGDLSPLTSGRNNNHIPIKRAQGRLCLQSMRSPTWFKNAPPGLVLENTWVQKIRDEHDGRVVPNQIDCWAEKYLIELTVFTFLCHRRAAAAVSAATAQLTTH